jgi:hypothetical protein
MNLRKMNYNPPVRSVIDIYDVYIYPASAHAGEGWIKTIRFINFKYDKVNGDLIGEATLPDDEYKKLIGLALVFVKFQCVLSGHPVEIDINDMFHKKEKIKINVKKC